MRSRVVLLVALLFAAPACGDGESRGEVTGVVTAVEIASLTELDGFTLRSEEETYEFVVDPDTELGFPPAHLNEHRVSGDPVTVVYEEVDGELVALSVEDA